jgi:hypothetical protein
VTANRPSMIRSTTTSTMIKLTKSLKTYKPVWDRLSTITASSFLRHAAEEEEERGGQDDLSAEVRGLLAATLLAHPPPF